MEFFRFERDIPFMSWGKYTTTISLLTFVLSVFFISYKGLNLGVDFTGGTVLEVNYTQPADLNKIRSLFSSIGISDASVQNFGSSRDVMIRLPIKGELSAAKLSEVVIDASPSWARIAGERCTSAPFCIVGYCCVFSNAF
jgi:preprotein translocase subunit SecF